MDLPKHTTSFLVSSLVLFGVGVALGAVHLSFHDAALSRRARKTFAVALSVTGLAAVVGYTQVLPEGVRIPWSDDYQAALQQAKTEHKPLLVDFGASWCGACKELEAKTFSDPRVVREGTRFIPVRIDLSPGEASVQKQQLLASYQQRGLPLLVLHNPTGEVAARVTSFVEPEELVRLMRAVR
jgi:thiol:disulfide interchange protein DsbD